MQKESPLGQGDFGDPLCKKEEARKVREGASLVGRGQDKKATCGRWEGGRQQAGLRGGRAEDGAKAGTHEPGMSKGRGCPKRPKGQGRVGSEVLSEGKQRCCPPGRLGTQHTEQRPTATVCRAWLLMPPPPKYSLGPKVKATCGKIY